MGLAVSGKIISFFFFISSLIFSQNVITKTIDPGGTGDYTSLKDWAASVTERGNNLIERDVIEVARCINTSGKADTQVVHSDSWITDSNHYVKIYVDSSFRHKGVFPADNSNIYRIVIASNGSNIISFITSKIIIDGLSIMNDLSDPASLGGNTIQLGDCDAGGYISNCILIENKCLTADPHGHGIRIDAAQKFSKYYIRNNIIYGYRNIKYTNPINCGILTYPTTDSMRIWIDNNTIYNCEYGIWNRGGESGYSSCRATVRNNIIQNTIQDGFAKGLVDTTQYLPASTNNVVLLSPTPLGALLNEGFESGTRFPFNNGTDSSIVSINNSPVHSGLKSLNLNVGWKEAGIFTDPLSVIPNSDYTLSFYSSWVWGVNFNVQIRAVSASGVLLAETTTPTSNSMTFVNQSVSFNSGNNSSIVIVITGGNGGGSCFFDDFLLYPGLVPPTSSIYFQNPDLYNLHLRSTASLAIGKAINLSSDFNDPFLTDIDGTIRIEPWDIGADQYNSIGDTALVPIQISPSNNSKGISKIPTISWGIAPGAAGYDLVLSNDSSFANLVLESSNLVSNSFQVNELSNNIKYYWKVRARNPGNISDWSDIWSFTTKLSTPNLITPENNSKNISSSPLLIWSEIIGADKYRLEVNNNSDFNGNIIYDVDTITNTNYKLNDLFKDSTYYWRVAALNNDKNFSDVSLTYNFTTETTTGIKELQNSVPDNYYIYQNYPNPFNPSTVIKYELPKDGMVSIKLYDMLGREVKTLINEDKPADTYSFTLDASDLASGIYLYRIVAGNFSQTRKMVLLK